MAGVRNRAAPVEPYLVRFAPLVAIPWLKTARQIMKQAMRWKLLAENPLSEIRAGGSTNRERMRFISRTDIQKVLAACPDAEWRLIIVLSRYGGVRVPSEVLPLTWEDIDFEKGLVHITSCKTEGYVGKERRIIPMSSKRMVVVPKAGSTAKNSFMAGSSTDSKKTLVFGTADLKVTLRVR